MGKRNGMRVLRSARGKVASRCSASGLAALLCSMGVVLAAGCNAAGGGGNQAGSSSGDADSAAGRKQAVAIDRSAPTPPVGFTLTEFFVDPDQANPSNPHEVLGSPLLKFKLHILGTFGQSNCYRIRIHRSNVWDGTCAGNTGAVASGWVDVPSTDPDDGFENRLVCSSGVCTEIIVQVRPNAGSSFRVANNWVIHVTERPDCSGGGQSTLTLPLAEPAAPSEYLTVGPCAECESDDDCPDDGLFCNGEESCDEQAGVCVSSGDPCEDDGLFCNGEESCDEDGDQCVSSGDPCPDDGLFCNGEESCDEGGDQCVSSGNPCPDDGLFCNGEESCDEGGDQCVASGNPCEDDGLFCNGEESCDEDADECVSSGDPCEDDGLFCNGEESCDEDADQCVSSGDPCEEDETCDEVRDMCLKIDCVCFDPISVSVACGSAEGADVGFPEFYYTDECLFICTTNGIGDPPEPQTDCEVSCHAYVDTNGVEWSADTFFFPVGGPWRVECDISYVETSRARAAAYSDTCEFYVTVSCLPPPPPPPPGCTRDEQCDDGNACTDDTCVGGKCVFTPNDELCDDQDECTDDWCDPVEGCMHEPVECPDDQDKCTNDLCDPVEGCIYEPVDCPEGQVCDPETGECVECLTDDDCDDGNPCTIDKCIDGACVHTDVECPDGQVCDPETGECVACQTDDECDDGDPCTVDECVDGACRHTDVECPEGQYCDPETGECVECLTDDECDDGDLCTRDECIDGVCQNTPIDCGPGATCDPETGECVERPAEQPGPPAGRGGCGIFNGVGLILLPMCMFLWLGLRSHARRRTLKR